MRFVPAGFTITEAWPLDTEMTSALKAESRTALASSIFLVAASVTTDAGMGSEADVMAELDEIIAERLDRAPAAWRHRRRTS